MRCTVCGGSEFRFIPVLWRELVETWELSEDESRYIDRQQGYCCTACMSNLRSMTLAGAILRAYGAGQRTFATFCGEDPAFRGLDVLEINEAGSLTKWLGALPGHRLAVWPELDLQAMHFADASWDLLAHSDTLEHVPDPDRALAECHRVLRPGGVLAYTVPVVVGRMTRRCSADRPSYHGGPDNPQADLLVHTEYGADFWTGPVRAGFSPVEIHCIEFPSAMALICRKGRGAATEVAG
jgi:SAM-dependent methyltransferase